MLGCVRLSWFKLEGIREVRHVNVMKESRKKVETLFDVRFICVGLSWKALRNLVTTPLAL
jgi:hypothetical protein